MQKQFLFWLKLKYTLLQQILKTGTLRFIAGVYLSLIYINRGFGIVALTHAFYDLFVIFQLT